jgi:hypothetical protein
VPSLAACVSLLALMYSECWVVVACLLFADNHGLSGGHPHHRDPSAHHAGTDDRDWASSGVRLGPRTCRGHDDGRLAEIA